MSVFRIFDGVRFIEDSASSGAEPPHYYVVSQSVAASAEYQNWTCVYQILAVEGALKRGQGITILARPFDAFVPTSYLTNDGSNIASVKYTCYHGAKGLFDAEWTAIEGHTNVDVSTTAVLETLETSDAWTKDEIGYTFRLTPNIVDNPLFTKIGPYRFVVTINLTTGNPIVIYHDVDVEE